MKNINEILKNNIKECIANNRLIEAGKLISEYELVYTTDIYINIFKAIILVIGNKLDEAKNILINLLIIDPENFDINYNLGFIYAQKKEVGLARFHYKMALKTCEDSNLRDDLTTLVNDIQHNYKECSRKRIVFFVRQGLDSFLGDIISEISGEYETKKIIVTDYIQIDEGMEWSDICWFEWCDELVSYGSKLNIVRGHFNLQ